MKEKSIIILHVLFTLLFVNRTSAQLNAVNIFQNRGFQIPQMRTTLDSLDKSAVNASDNRESKKQLVQNIQTQLSKDQILMELDRINGRKNRDLILFLITYGLTIIVDYTVDDNVFYGSFIPVVGPFLNIAEIEDYKGAKTDKALFLLSGVLQTFLSVDFLLAINKGNQLKQQLYLGVVPFDKRLAMKISYRF